MTTKQLTLIVWILLLILFAPRVWCQTYYVTQAGGDGSPNDGLTYGHAFSLAQHAAATFTDDDIIYLCDTWRSPGSTSMILIPSSGHSGAPIQYRGDYAGHAAILDASIDIANDGWTGPDVNGNYTIAATICSFLIEDGKPLKKGASATLDEAGTWWWAANTITYRPSSGAPTDHTQDRSTPNYTIRCDQSYVNFDAITFRYALSGINSTSAVTNSDININNCTFEYSWIGVLVYALDATTKARINVTNCTFKNIACGLDYVAGGGVTSTSIFDACTLTGNTFTEQQIAYGSSGTTWEEIIAGETACFALQNIQNSDVSHNTMTNTSALADSFGVEIYACATGSVLNNTIHSNISTNIGTGINVYGSTTSAEISGNSVFNNAIIGSTRTSGAFRLAGPTTPPNALYNYLYNNTVNGCYMAYYIPYGDYWDIRNNIFSGWTNSIEQITGNPTHMVINNNDIYPDATGNNFYFNGSVRSKATWQGYLYDTAAASIFTDPLLTTYTIGYSSPCKDTGITLPSVTTDIVGRSRYIGTAPDIGCHEYAPGNTGGSH